MGYRAQVGWRGSGREGFQQRTFVRRRALREKPVFLDPPIHGGYESSLSDIGHDPTDLLYTIYIK